MSGVFAIEEAMRLFSTTDIQNCIVAAVDSFIQQEVIDYYHGFCGRNIEENFSKSLQQPDIIAEKGTWGRNLDESGW